MPDQKRFSPKLFDHVSLEELVPQDHILRQFESLRSLDYLHEETRRYYRHTGHPSVDPVVLFKMKSTAIWLPGPLKP